jgi:hypothetical protein
MDMISAIYNASSPYSVTPQTNKYVTYLDHWTVPTLSYSTEDQYIYLGEKYRHRPDLLSYDWYGTPKLWWVFSVYNVNTIKDPIYDMVPGIQVLIPSKSNLTGLL